MSAVLLITDSTRTSFNVAEGPQGDITQPQIYDRFTVMRGTNSAVSESHIVGVLRSITSAPQICFERGRQRANVTALRLPI